MIDDERIYHLQMSEKNAFLTRLEDYVELYESNNILNSVDSKLIVFPYENDNITALLHKINTDESRLFIYGKNMKFSTFSKRNETYYDIKLQKFTINEANEIEDTLLDTGVYIYFNEKSVIDNN